MVISEGSGMQADSIVISTRMPRYPVAEITATMMPPRNSINWVSIGRLLG